MRIIFWPGRFRLDLGVRGQDYAQALAGDGWATVRQMDGSLVTYRDKAPRPALRLDVGDLMAIPLENYEGVPIARLPDMDLSIAIAHVEAVQQDLVSQAQYAESKYRPVIHDAYETALMDLSNELSQLVKELRAERQRRGT